MVWLSLIMVFVLTLMTSGCGTTEPVGGGSRFFDILIENQTDQVLTIFDENYEVGSAEPGEQIIMKNQSMNRYRHTIKAANAEGEIVFSEIYTLSPNDKYHLQEIEERLYKAVIPPLED